MKSNVGRLAGLVLVWWFSDLLGCLFSLFVLYHIGLSLYRVYKDNTSDSQEQVEVDKERDVIVVSGCDSGIGKAVADKLVKKFRVIATVVDPESPAAVALGVEGVELLKMDLTCEESIKTTVEKILTALSGNKRLHAVVNNAGVCIMGELDWLKTEQVDTMMKVNLTGPILFTKLLLPRIISDKSRIVNVTGLDGIYGTAGMATYCSSKFGMEGFTDSLRLELAQHEVRVITVRPGDYSSLTSSTHKQDEYRSNMWSAMDTSKQQRYAAEFDAFGKAVTNISGTLGAANFEGIRSTLEQIMINKNPEDEYNEGNNLNITAHKIISVLPKPCSGKLRSKVLDQIKKIHLYRR